MVEDSFKMFVSTHGFTSVQQKIPQMSGLVFYKRWDFAFKESDTRKTNIINRIKEDRYTVFRCNRLCSFEMKVIPQEHIKATYKDGLNSA